MGSPGLKLLAQPTQVNSFLIVGKVFEFFQAFLEQRTESRRIALRVMVECSRNLDEAVQEDFLFAIGFQPHFFKYFVSFKKLLRIEQVNAFVYF